MLIAGGVIGIATQFFQDEITQFLFGILGVDGTKMVGGGLSISMGGLTINVGSKLIGKTGWGTAGGIALIVIGAVLATFGIAEITEVIIDVNFIKELTHISDLAYSNIYKGLNYVAAVTVITSNVLSKFYKL